MITLSQVEWSIVRNYKDCPRVYYSILGRYTSSKSPIIYSTLPVMVRTYKLNELKSKNSHNNGSQRFVG